MNNDEYRKWEEATNKAWEKRNSMTDILYHIGKALAHAWRDHLVSPAKWTAEYGWAQGVDVGQDKVVRVTVEVVEKAPYVLEPLVEHRLEEVTA